MDKLFELLKDRYTPADLIDELDIDMDDLLFHLSDYLEENLDVFSEELREFFEDGDLSYD